MRAHGWGASTRLFSNARAASSGKETEMPNNITILGWGSLLWEPHRGGQRAYSSSVSIASCWRSINDADETMSPSDVSISFTP